MSCRAERQDFELSTIGRHAVKSRMRAAAIAQNRSFMHGIRVFGRLVHVHEVIEKTAGNVSRCSCDDAASGRRLELPA